MAVMWAVGNLGSLLAKHNFVQPLPCSCTLTCTFYISLTFHSAKSFRRLEFFCFVALDEARQSLTQFI